jgi:dienelactone hydrolase
MSFRVLFVTTALVLCAARGSSQSLPVEPDNGLKFHLTEKPGAYTVGLKVVQQYDYSRTYRPKVDAIGRPAAGERARPLQTLIWYPAEKSGQKLMTVGDYSELLATETSFDKPQPWGEFKRWVDGMKPTLSDALWAKRDAAALTGKFPLVIYAPSFSAMSWENVDLCEYLASHGYVVIASPSLGATARVMTNDLQGIDAQARDISFLIAYARTLPDADMSKIAVAGFSWGGISNLFAAARDNRIDALVALDGSMRYFPGLVKDTPDVRPDEITLPMLFFTQGEISIEEQARDFADKNNQGPNVLNAWTHGDLITVDDMALDHVEHSSMYQRNEEVWKHFHENRKGDYSRADGTTGYAWMTRYTLEFLNAYLKHDPAAARFLKKSPAENGVPPHILTVNFRSAKGAPDTFEGLRIEAGEKGFDHLLDLYAALQKEKPNFKIEDTALHLWATDLRDEDHLPEAIDVLKLEAHVYPDSGDTYVRLGEAYQDSGQKQLTSLLYRSLLIGHNDNENAVAINFT